MEPVSMLIAAGLIAVGYITGRIHRKKPPAPDPTDFRGCKHSLSYRDKTTGACTASVEVANKWDKYSTAIGFEWRPCACTNHTTAEQITLDASWNPPTLPPAAQ